MVRIVEHLVLVAQRTALADDEILHAAVRALGHFPFKTKIELLVSAPGDDVAAAAPDRVLKTAILDHPALCRELAAPGVHPLIG